MESSVVVGDGGSRSTVAPDARMMSRRPSYSSIAFDRSGGAVKLRSRHPAAMVCASTNASRGCFMTTRVNRSVSESTGAVIGPSNDYMVCALLPSRQDRLAIEQHDADAHEPDVDHGEHGCDHQNDGHGELNAAGELANEQRGDRQDDECPDLLRAARIVDSRRHTHGELQRRQRRQRAEQEYDG